MTVMARVSRTVRQVALAVATEPTTFSIVVPAFNERDDITATLDALLAQRHRPKEVIVVDGGSTDGTRELLRERAARDAITLIEEPRRRGVAAARNAGIDAATGDVVVILNADVVPPPDFLQRLDEAYRRGAGMVSVQSRVINMDCATGRFLQATHDLEYGPDAVGWTEGFSCRREAARRARFPEELPGAGGEDVEFFARLRGQDLKWDVDYSIVVSHRVPPTLGQFWQQWRGRGNAVPYVERRLRKRPLEVVIATRALASLKSGAQIVAVYPMVRRARQRARLSPRGMDDLWPFWLLAHVQVLAHRAGEWETIARLLRERKSRR